MKWSSARLEISLSSELSRAKSSCIKSSKTYLFIVMLVYWRLIEVPSTSCFNIWLSARGDSHEARDWDEVVTWGRITWLSLASLAGGLSAPRHHLNILRIFFFWRYLWWLLTRLISWLFWSWREFKQRHARAKRTDNVWESEIERCGDDVWKDWMSILGLVSWQVYRWPRTSSSLISISCSYQHQLLAKAVKLSSQRKIPLDQMVCTQPKRNSEFWCSHLVLNVQSSYRNLYNGEHWNRIQGGSQ